MIERLDADQDLIGLVMPPDFEAALMRGDKGAVQLFLDGSRAAHSALADAYVQQIVSGLSLEVAIKRLGLPPAARDALPIVEPALRVRFNPNREESFYQGLQRNGDDAGDARAGAAGRRTGARARARDDRAAPGLADDAVRDHAGEDDGQHGRPVDGRGDHGVRRAHPHLPSPRARQPRVVL